LSETAAAGERLYARGTSVALSELVCGSSLGGDLAALNASAN